MALRPSITISIAFLVSFLNGVAGSEFKIEDYHYIYYVVVGILLVVLVTALALLWHQGTYKTSYRVGNAQSIHDQFREIRGDVHATATGSKFSNKGDVTVRAPKVRNG